MDNDFNIIREVRVKAATQLSLMKIVVERVLHSKIIARNCVRNDLLHIVQYLAITVTAVLFQPPNDTVCISHVPLKVLMSEAKGVIAVSLGELLVKEVEEAPQNEN
jgi:hypothetical protein